MANVVVQLRRYIAIEEWVRHKLNHYNLAVDMEKPKKLHLKRPIKTDAQQIRFN